MPAAPGHLWMADINSDPVAALVLSGSQTKGPGFAGVVYLRSSVTTGAFFKNPLIKLLHVG
jgi:hypothetical protein